MKYHWFVHLPIVAVLAACSKEMQQPTVWDLATPGPGIEATPLQLRHTVYFATDSFQLSAAEKSSLAAFAGGLRGGATKRIRIIGHTDLRSDRGYNQSLSERRARNVAAELRRLGVRNVEVTLDALGENAPTALGSTEQAHALNRRVELVATTYSVQVQGCNGADLDLRNDHANLPSPQLGCSNLRNLAEMADPLDLLPADMRSERPLAPADSQQQFGAIDRYRTNELPELQNESGSQ